MSQKKIRQLSQILAIAMALTLVFALTCFATEGAGDDAAASLTDETGAEEGAELEIDAIDAGDDTDIEAETVEEPTEEEEVTDDTPEEEIDDTPEEEIDDTPVVEQPESVPPTADTTMPVMPLMVGFIVVATGVIVLRRRATK